MLRLFSFRFFNILLCILSLPITLFGSPGRFVSSSISEIGVFRGCPLLFFIASWIFSSYSLVRSSFLSARSIGQNCSRRIFAFSEGSVV